MRLLTHTFASKPRDSLYQKMLILFIVSKIKFFVSVEINRFNFFVFEGEILKIIFIFYKY